MDMQSVTSFKVGNVEFLNKGDEGVIVRQGEHGIAIPPEAARELARAVRCWFPKPAKA